LKGGGVVVGGSYGSRLRLIRLRGDLGRLYKSLRFGRVGWR
jgi:hypothetical protein